MFTFLAIDGIAVTAGAEAAWRFVSTRYEAHDFRFDRLEAWLRTNTQMV